MVGRPRTEQSTAVQSLPTLQVSRRCIEETERFFAKEASDASFCFELFRRAAEDGDQLAWDRLFHCYETLLIGWIRRHPSFPSSGESAPHFANRAFERLWNALTSDGFDRFDDLKSILRYLQLCVHSAIIDHVRIAKLETIAIEDMKSIPIHGSDQSPVESIIGERSQAQDLWQHVESCLTSQEERAVVYAAFVLELKPRQIQAQYEKLFPDVGDVYRVKQNVITRLRRDPKITGFLGHD